MCINRLLQMNLSYCICTVFAFLITISCKNKKTKSSTSMYSEDQTTDTTFIDCLERTVNIGLLPIETVHHQSFSEGNIVTVKTKDSSYVILNCLFNSGPNLLAKDKYEVLDSVLMRNGGYSYRGVDSKSGKYWRRDGNISYLQVKPKDTIRYNLIFDNENFIRRMK